MTSGDGDNRKAHTMNKREVRNHINDEIHKKPENFLAIQAWKA